MKRKPKKLVFRKKLAIFKRIKRAKTHCLVESGFYSIKRTIEVSEEISPRVKEDLLMVFAVIKPGFDEIIYLFEDSDS